MFQPWLYRPTGRRQLVEGRFIRVYLKKSKKKTAAFYCQRFGNLQPGYPGSQSKNLLVVRTLSKTRLTFLTGVTLLTTQSGHYRQLSTGRQHLFLDFF